MSPDELAQQRLDKWLWAARFYKTRALAAKAVAGGHVRIEGRRVKPAAAVVIGTRLYLTLGYDQWEITVRQLSPRRGPSTEAKQLYIESDTSQLGRAQRAEAQKRLREERQLRAGRPTRRDRRELMKLKREAE